MKGKDNAIVPYRKEKNIRIVQYQPDDSTNLDVRFEDGTVWLTQQQMAELFRYTKQNISLHINNTFKEGELKQSETVKEYLTVHSEGGHKVTRNMKHYNLYVIVAVGRRVRSRAGTSFREWATKIIENEEKTTKIEKIRGEIEFYRLDDSSKLEVMIENDTVWLNRQQISILFGRDVKTIGKHINNALKEELSGLRSVANFATHLDDGRLFQVAYYNLDVIISVGYRVKSDRGIQFRTWSNRVLKDHVLRDCALNYNFERIERRFLENDKKFTENDKNFGMIGDRLAETEKKIDFFVKTSLPPVYGIFYEGEIFDAYAFVCDLIRGAKRSVVLIDNYIDETVLLLLSKRSPDVDAKIYTKRISAQLGLDLNKHNAQYAPVEVRTSDRFHDRFLVIDDTVYHIGASLKDLGKKLFAFSRIEIRFTDLSKGL